MSGIRLDTVDWERMAEPQPDQYDTRVTLSVAKDLLGTMMEPRKQILRCAHRL